MLLLLYKKYNKSCHQLLINLLIIVLVYGSYTKAKRRFTYLLEELKPPRGNICNLQRTEMLSRASKGMNRLSRGSGRKYLIEIRRKNKM